MLTWINQQYEDNFAEQVNLEEIFHTQTLMHLKGSVGVKS